MKTSPSRNDVVTIALNAYEMKILLNAAKNRTESNRQAGNHKNKIFMTAKGTDHLFSEMVGLCGELAVSKFLCIEIPSLVFDQKYFNENKHKIRDVGSFEVKSTHYKTGKLILQEKHMNDGTNLNTKYVFCTVEINGKYESAQVRIVGYATPADMSCNGQKIQSQYNTAWYLEQQFLHPINSLSPKFNMKEDDL